MLAHPFVSAAHQAPRSMGFSRQEYRRGLPFPPPGGLPTPGTEPACPASRAVAGRFFTLSHPGSPPCGEAPQNALQGSVSWIRGSGLDSVFSLELEDECWQTKYWVCSPAGSKASLLTPGRGEGECSTYCQATSAASGQLTLKTPQLPTGFQPGGGCDRHALYCGWQRRGDRRGSQGLPSTPPAPQTWGLCAQGHSVIQQLRPPLRLGVSASVEGLRDGTHCFRVLQRGTPTQDTWRGCPRKTQRVCSVTWWS